MKIQIVTAINNNEFEVTENAIKRGERIATYLRSIAIASGEAERDILKLHKAEFLVKNDALVLIPSAPLEVTAIAIEPLYKNEKKPGTPVGEPKFIGAIALKEPIRITEVSVNAADLSSEEVTLSAKTPYFKPSISSTNNLAEYYIINFSLDSHTLAVVEN
jgi:hypothetical protein